MLRMNERKILGVLGGMGPLATCEFLRGIVDLTAAARDQDHLDVLVYSHATLPNRTAAILTGQTESLIDRLTKDAAMLEQNGAGVLAVPCNTSHVFYDQIQAAVQIPVIHIVRETIGALEGARTVGVLATEGTVKTEIYGLEGAKAGIRVLYPSPEVQHKVTDIIERIKRGERMDTWMLRTVAEELLNNGCQRVILACTELSCAVRNGPREPRFVDAMDVLIRKSIQLCGGQVKG